MYLVALPLSAREKDVILARLLCCVVLLSAEGEHIEMGGIIDPEGTRALIYRETTMKESIQPEEGSGFQKKVLKTVKSEISWIGVGDPEEEGKQSLLVYGEVKEEEEPWYDETVEQNPLYSSSDYISDFSNPAYTQRASTAEGAAVAAGEVQLPKKDGGRAARGRPDFDDKGRGYEDYFSAPDTYY